MKNLVFILVGITLGLLFSSQISLAKMQRLVDRMSVLVEENSKLVRELNENFTFIPYETYDYEEKN